MEPFGGPPKSRIYILHAASGCRPKAWDILLDYLEVSHL
jgi:hypothetical protein